MSGVDIGDRQVRKGAAGAVIAWVHAHGGDVDRNLMSVVERHLGLRRDAAGGGGASTARRLGRSA